MKVVGQGQVGVRVEVDVEELAGALAKAKNKTFEDRPSEARRDSDHKLDKEGRHVVIVDNNVMPYRRTVTRCWTNDR